MFTKQAEQLIFAAVDLPALRKNQTGTTTLNNKYLTMPSNMLYVYSLAVIDANNEYYYLLNKDVSFIREAYPVAATAGLPVHYGIFGDGTFILGPTPDAAYASEIHFAKYPTSIVTAGTSYLGTEFDSTLLNGALVQAIRFQKGEGDMVTMYENMYVQSLALLRNLGAGRLETDTFRNGVVRVPPQ
tara:strand:+ start:275 stop:832 length:558 start_codon:yes stop_codon:yes gene_type:complete